MTELGAGSHPIHPALVHFPVACWTLASVADVAGLWVGKSAWALAGTLMIVGLVMAVPAMIAGVFEFVRIPDDGPAMGIVLWHMGAAMTALLLYGCSLLLRLDHRQIGPPGSVALGLSIAGLLVLLVAGWLGGTLVYRHGIGQRQA